MQITEEKISDQNALLTIAISPEDYAQKFDRALKGYQKQVSMPGFRTGKVPMGVVKKRYGKSVLVEELNKVLNQSIQQYITDKNLQILGSPIPASDRREKGDWDNPSDFEFVYELGLAPELDVNVSAKDQFDYHTIAVDDNMIEEQIGRMRRRYGKIEKVSEVESNDMLSGDFVELDAQDEVNSSGIFTSSTLTLESIDAEVSARFVGKAEGDEVIFDPMKLASSHGDIARIMGVGHEQVHHLHTNFKFIIRGIQRMHMADLDKAFLDRMLGEGTTETDLREKIRTDLNENFKKDSDQLFRRDISTKMVAKHQPSLPDTFLKRWIVLTNEKPISPEQVEQDYYVYRNGLQWQLIFNSLIKQKAIVIEPESLIEKTKGIMAAQYSQYGMPTPDDDELTETARKVLGNQEEARRVMDMVYDDKLVAFIRENATVNEKSVSYDEFVKLASEA